MHFYLDNTAPNTTAPTATSTTNSIVVTSAQTDSNSGIRGKHKTILNKENIRQ